MWCRWWTAHPHDRPLFPAHDAAAVTGRGPGAAMPRRRPRPFGREFRPAPRAIPHLPSSPPGRWGATPSAFFASASSRSGPRRACFICSPASTAYHAGNAGPCSFVFHRGFDPTGMMALSSISRPASGGPWSMAAPAGRRPTVPAVPDSRTGHPPGAGGLPKPVFRPTHVRSVSLPRASPGHTGNVARLTNGC